MSLIHFPNQVPWSRLGQDPVIVYLDRIFLLAEPAMEVEGHSEDGIQEVKKTRVRVSFIYFFFFWGWRGDEEIISPYRRLISSLLTWSRKWKSNYWRGCSEQRQKRYVYCKHYGSFASLIWWLQVFTSVMYISLD